jgi:hypothetical protein
MPQVPAVSDIPGIDEAALEQSMATGELDIPAMGAPANTGEDIPAPQ